MYSNYFVANAFFPLFLYVLHEQRSSMGSMTSCESLLEADLGIPSDGALLRQSGGGANAVAGSGSGPRERVAIVGSGNWGSAIARIVGRNVVEQVHRYKKVYIVFTGQFYTGDRDKMYRYKLMEFGQLSTAPSSTRHVQ